MKLMDCIWLWNYDAEKNHRIQTEYVGQLISENKKKHVKLFEN